MLYNQRMFEETPASYQCKLVLYCLTTRHSLALGFVFYLVSISISISISVQYETIHRYDTNKLRNVAKFFGHLLYTDAIPWTVSSTFI